MQQSFQPKEPPAFLRVPYPALLVMSTVTHLQSLPTPLGTTTRAVLFGAFEAIIVFAIVAATLDLGCGLGVRLNGWERT
jgi:hypothetical protein